MKDENKFIFGGDDATEELENSIESSDDDSISSDETIYDNNDVEFIDDVEQPKNDLRNKKDNIQNTLNNEGSKVLQKLGVPKGIADKGIKQGTFADKLPGSKLIKNKAMNTLAKSPVGDMLGGSKKESIDENGNNDSKKSIADGLTSQLKSGLGSKLGLPSDNQNGNINPVKIANKIKKYKMILPMIPIGLKVIIVLVIIIAIVMIPATFMPEIKNVGQKFKNLWSHWKFESNEQIIDGFYEEVDKVVGEIELIGVQVNKDLLVSGLTYGAYLIEDYANVYDDKDGMKELVNKYAKITEYVFSVANQMIYKDALIHHDTYFETHTVINEEGEAVQVTVEYCYGQEINEQKRKNLEKYSDNYHTKENTTGTSKTCAIITYSEDLEKFEKFLKYIYIPTETYGIDTKEDADGFFLEIARRLKSFLLKEPFKDPNRTYNREYYNIRSKDIGTLYNGYKSLTEEQKEETDNTIRTILSLAQTSSTISDKYYIKGATTLPVDISSGTSIADRLTNKLSYYGPRESINGTNPFHAGIDISHITYSDPIYSIADGVVVEANPRGLGSYGNNITIGHDIDLDGKYDYYSRYAHLKTLSVLTGDSVNNGQQIGIMGTTGISTGIHLHFELRDEKLSPMDPLPFLINIENNQSELATLETSPFTKKQAIEYENELLSKIGSVLGTRNAVVNSSKYLGEKFKGLPYFCGGYTTKRIDDMWYQENTITDKSCSNIGEKKEYGLDVNGFVSWVLGTSGVSNKKKYSIDELAELGTKVELNDSRINVGDFVWKENNIGIIIEKNETRLTIVYMNVSKGLSIETINRAYNGLFGHAILVEYLRS